MMEILQKLLSELPKGYEIKTIDGSNVGLLPQLFAVHCDTLFAWTGKSLVAATGIKTTNSTNLTFNKLSVLTLTCIPFGRVLRLEINRCGSNLALVCSDYCYVVEIPKAYWFFRSKTEIEDEYLCKCIQLDASSHESSSVNYLRVRWHTGSPNDRHLVTLKADNVLRIYNVDSAKNTIAVQCIILSRIDSFASVSPRAQDLLSSIGESAVSFDFGPPVNVPLISKEPLYPIFILYGNGNVYNVLTDLSHLRHFPVCGPLTITPASEDNYGVDSCDLLVLSSSKNPDAVTVLVIATSYGNLYHAVVFVEESSDGDHIGVTFSLHVYESVELEFSLSTLDLITKELKEDACASPVCLYKDDFVPDTYYCQHSAGLHIIRLPWIHDFEYFNSLNSPGSVSEADGISDSSCLIDYRLCTCPKPSDRFTPLCGLATMFQNSTDTILITLLPDFDLHASLLSNDRYTSNKAPFSAAKTDQSENQEKRTNHNKQSFLDHLKNELKRNSTIPLLKAPNKEISEKEAAEILFRSVSLLKTEYIDKLIAGQQLCIERCHNSVTLWHKQKSNIEKLLKFLNKVSARRGEVVKRVQKIRQIQHKNADKLDFINENLAEKSHNLSFAEENMLREMQNLKSKMDMSLEKLNLLDQSTSNYCQKLAHNAPSRSNLSNSAEIELQKIIKNQSQQIEWLMDNLKRLNES